MAKLKKATRSTKDIVEEVVEDIKKPVEKDKKKSLNTDDLIPTGSTILNCALSDNPFGGYGKGKVVNIIGDSSSGKTLLALTGLAEACMDKRFDDYDLIFGDVENTFEFDINYLFGKKVEKRIIIDQVPDKIQDWYLDVYKLLKKEKPFMYVLDSLDSLASDEDLKKIEEKIKKEKRIDRGEKVKKDKGSYGVQKPRVLSDMLRTIKGMMRRTGSLLIIISQTRDNIGFGAMFQPKVRSGGKALKFYSTHEFWLSIVERQKAKEREIGAYTEINVTKNKLTGKRRKAEMLLYYDYGIDDISCNIDFLVGEGCWEKKKQTIIAPDFDFEGTHKRLVKHIEDNRLEKELSKIIGTVWNDIEDSIRLDRRRRYE